MPPINPEHLLKAQLKGTTPEFERRWTQLKRELRNTPQPRAPLFGISWAWWAIPSFLAMCLLGLILYSKHTKPEPFPADQIDTFVQLLELDDSLQGALPLTDPSLTDLIIDMPVTQEEHS